MSFAVEAAIFLGAAVATVPLAKRFGLGSVLGYLGAGLLIGPSVLGLVEDVEAILHFSEFGVVLLLFLIGMELQPARLWALRKPIFGHGGAQMALTTIALSGIGMALGLSWLQALVIGASLSLSSTAFALQILAEKQQLTTKHGRSAFTILLFQDLAAIPLIALVPVLGFGMATDPTESSWLQLVEVLLAVGGLILVGSYLVGPLLRLVAHSRTPEMFVATSLLIVVGAAALMEWAELSMGLGAFLAGVLLAKSEFRHEVVANIDPFKGLLLGLFFIAVGMQVDLALLVTQPVTVIGLAIGLVAVKGMVLWGIGWWIGLPARCSRGLVAALCQGGEFAFVLMTVAVSAAVLSPETATLVIMVVTLSMACTPLVFMINEKLLDGKDTPATPTSKFNEAIAAEESPVIIAGFGRFGQIIGRVLRVKKISFTAIDNNISHIDFVRRFGSKVFYGDASRLEMLRAAHADKAKVLVLAMDDPEKLLHTAELAKKHFPHLILMARARNRTAVFQLKELGVDLVVRETFHSSLEVATETLQALGLDAATSARVTARFQEHDRRVLEEQAKIYKDEEKLVASAHASAKQLEELFGEDATGEQEEERLSSSIAAQ